MAVMNVAQARKELHNVVDAVLTGDMATITSKNGNIVMISEEEWEDVKETIYLMGVPGLMDDIREARNTPLSELEEWNKPPGHVADKARKEIGRLSD
jgi:prevent-host-death family protein